LNLLRAYAKKKVHGPGKSPARGRQDRLSRRGENESCVGFSKNIRRRHKRGTHRLRGKGDTKQGWASFDRTKVKSGGTRF